MATAVPVKRPARRRPGELVALLAAAVVAVSLFLPWYGIAVGSVGVTASGLAVHSYLWVAFALCIALVLYVALALLAPAVAVAVPAHPAAIVAELQLLTLALVVVGFFAKAPAAGWCYGSVMAVAAAGAGTAVGLAGALSPAARSGAS